MRSCSRAVVALLISAAVSISAADSGTTLPTNGKYVQVTSPNEGETLWLGDTLHVTWRALDSSVHSVVISIYTFTNTGAGWQQIGSYNDPALIETGHFALMIPESFGGQASLSDSCLVAVTLNGIFTDPGLHDESDSAFRIARRVDLVCPDGGEVFNYWRGRG
jgi:hypothetical protein